MPLLFWPGLIVSTHLPKGVPILPQNFGGCQPPATKNPTNCGVFGAPKFYHKILGAVKRPLKYPTWAWGHWSCKFRVRLPGHNTYIAANKGLKDKHRNPTRKNGKESFQPLLVHVKQHLPILLGKDFVLDFESRNKKDKNPTLD